MATMRTSIRDVSRPIAVDDNEPREAHRSRNKHHSRRRQRTRRHEPHQKSSQPSHAVALPSNKISDLVPDPDDASLLELMFMHQPERKIDIGRSIKVDVMVSLRYSPQHPSIKSMHLDHSGLLTFATLLTEDENGQLYPTDASALQAQKIFDSVHSFQHTEQQCAMSWYQLSDGLPLGYSSFPELQIARTGVFRIRITLMKTGASAEEGAVNVTCIDSMPITVCPPLTRRR